MNPNELEDEILELLWVNQERGDLSLASLRGRHPDYFKPDHISHLESGRWICEGDGKINLTETGRRRAQEIIRRHRLAERLLKDVMGVEERQFETEACAFEHALTPGIVDSICTLLGHPKECPHGSAIPEGDCCRQFRESVGPIIVPVTQMKMGERAVVAYLNAKNYSRIKKLSAFGIVPGAAVTLVQRSPAYVVSVEESQIAIEKQVAADVYIRRDVGQSHL